MELYETLDIYRAAFLEYEGFKVTLSQNRTGRVLFSFPYNPELEQALERYENKEPIAALVFADRIKDIKRRMHTARGFNYGSSRR